MKYPFFFKKKITYLLKRLFKIRTIDKHTKINKFFPCLLKNLFKKISSNKSVSLGEVFFLKSFIISGETCELCARVFNFFYNKK